jgi:hypothetical protein
MSENNPYDFILNPEKPKKTPVDIKANPKMMLAFIIFSLLIIVVAFAALSALIGSGSNSQKQNLVDMRLQQTEIIRVSEMANDKESASDVTKNLALNIKLTILSHEQNTMTLLGKRGQDKVDPKLLASSSNPKTDALLNDAAKQNKFNETYRNTLKSLLEEYQTNLQKAYDSGNKSEQAELKEMYDETKKLLESIK